MPIKIHPIPALSDNYIWTIIDLPSQNALCVDPGEASPVLNYINKAQINLKAILITHRHHDHTGGIAQLVKETECEVFGPSGVKGTTSTLLDDESFKVEPLELSFHVMHIPAHTTEHIALYNKKHNFLFTGDTLFAAGCGRVFEGTHAQMLDSLNKLKHFPDDTKIYCGHEYTKTNLQFAHLIEPENKDVEQRLEKISKMRDEGQVTLPSTLLDEKKTNPFLRAHEPKLRKALETYIKRDITDDLDAFSVLRTLKDEFKGN